MKTIALIILMVIQCSVANAQYSGYAEKKIDIYRRGNLTILQISAKDFGLGGQAYGDYKLIKSFKLDNDAKLHLVNALRKSLSWGVLNVDKKIEFVKIVDRINGYFNVNNFRDSNNESSSVYVSFSGEQNGGHKIALCDESWSLHGETYANDLDIRHLGVPFWQFESDQKVRDFIAMLEKQYQNPDDIFK